MKVRFTAKEMNKRFKAYEVMPAFEETKYFNNWASVNRYIRDLQRKGKMFYVTAYSKPGKYIKSHRYFIGTETDFYPTK